jgi:AcrR family transcriptional regulator
MRRLSGPDRREALIEATADLIRAQGLATTTTRDVTARLGVGAGLLNHYFSWSDLRAAAFEHVVLDDLHRTLLGRTGDPAKVVLSDLHRDAFSFGTDPVWRCWIEAADLAAADPALAAALARCTELWRKGVFDLLQRGAAEGRWRCDDPEGASWRLIALLDGLVGLTIGPQARLARDAAASYFLTAIGYECRGFGA